MRRLLLGLATVSIVSAVGLSAGTAWAGYKMEIDESPWISLGMGTRFAAGAVEQESDEQWGKNFQIDSIRPYISGQVHEYIKFETNFDFNYGTGQNAEMQLLDGIAKFEFNDYANIWGGRLLPPSDRANLSGPYYLNAWAFPVIAQKYPAIFAGRDNGVVGFGQVGGGAFKYAAGVFEGNSAATSPQLNVRLTLNLLDPEPGYYNSSTYFGEKDILAIGGVLYYQTKGARDGTAARREDFVGWNIDLLFEKNLGAIGTPTIDAAFYGYSNGGANGTNGPVGPNRPDGKSFYITGGWFLPGEHGYKAMKGLIQPHVRYQKFYNDAGSNQSRWDAGVSWYIRQQNAKFVLYYFRQKHNTSPSSYNISKGFHEGVNLGFQLQF